MAEKVKLVGVANGAGTAADVKALSIVGGMVAGADSIDDLDMLRHGGLSRLSGFAPTREEAAWAAERMDSDGHQLAFCRGIHDRMSAAQRAGLLRLPAERDSDGTMQ
ncbi:hypothetical protein [Streptomyces sp. NPDC051364]|uniref:hypothetical protein n=1 Tax=Streptomyces sp. NPDC051364 TaxID=3155799 RepID=UPI003447F451